MWWQLIDWTYIAVNNVFQFLQIIQGCLPILHQDFWGQFTPHGIQEVTVCGWQLTEEKQTSISCIPLV